MKKGETHSENPTFQVHSMNAPRLKASYFVNKTVRVMVLLCTIIRSESSNRVFCGQVSNALCIATHRDLSHPPINTQPAPSEATRRRRCAGGAAAAQLRASASLVQRSHLYPINFQPAGRNTSIGRPGRLGSVRPAPVARLSTAQSGSSPFQFVYIGGRRPGCLPAVGCLPVTSCSLRVPFDIFLQQMQRTFMPIFT